MLGYSGKDVLKVFLQAQSGNVVDKPAHSVCSRISVLRYRLCREIRLGISLTSELCGGGFGSVTVNMLYWSVCKENEDIIQNSTSLNIRNISWRSGIHWRCRSLSGWMNSNLTIAVTDIIHRTVFYLKTRCFGDFILSPSSGRICLRTALSVGPIWVSSTWRRRQRPVSETSCFK
jgi:hypothetical protein